MSFVVVQNLVGKHEYFREYTSYLCVSCSIVWFNLTHACLLLRLIVVFVGFISQQIYQMSKNFESCLNWICLCLLYFMTKFSNLKGLHIMPKVQTLWTFYVFLKIVGPRIFKSSITLKNFSSMFIRFFTSWLTLKNFRDP